MKITFKNALIVFAASFVFILPGCQMVGSKNAPSAPVEPIGENTEIEEFVKNFQYSCTDGKAFAVKMNTSGNKVLFIETGKEPLLFNQTTSGSGIRYSDGKTVFWAKGETAFVEDAVGTRIYDECSTPDSDNGTGGENSVKLANPASANCINQGGKLEMRNGERGEYGVCLFEDNRQCEEWALLRGNCPVGGKKITGYDNEAEIYCAITGGQVQGVGTDNPMCKRIDGTLCNAQENFDGECPEPDDSNPNAENVGTP